MKCYLPLQDEIKDLTNFEGQWGECVPNTSSGSKVADTRFQPVSYAVPIQDHRSTEPATCYTPGTQFQFAWDSTSLGELKTCPRKYNYAVRLGYTHKIMPPPLSFGIHYHTCMEVWHKLIITHKLPPEIAILRITRLAGLLGETISTGDTARTKETLVRSVLWYIDTFAKDPARTITLRNGTPAVEYSFTVPFVEVNGIQTYLCGHIDRVVQFQDGVYPTDYKTTKRQLDSRFFLQFKPNTQMLHYVLGCFILATEDTALPEPPDGIIIDALQLGVNYTRFQRQIVPYSPEEIEDYIVDTTQWLKLAAIFAEANHWPANEKSCDNYGGCMFREICRQKPQYREMALKANFVQRTWDPLKPR